MIVRKSLGCLYAGLYQHNVGSMKCFWKEVRWGTEIRSRFNGETYRFVARGEKRILPLDDLIKTFAKLLCADIVPNLAGYDFQGIC